MLLVSGAVLVGSCTSSTSESEHAISSVGGEAAPTPSRGGVPTVGCDAAIGGGQPSPGWRQDAVEVAPLTFVGVRLVNHDDRAFISANGRFEALKVPLLVGGGVPVRLVVPPEEVSRVSLLYDPSTWGRMRNGRYKVSDGDLEVAFDACEGSTWFAGGFVVSDGPRCIVLDAYVGSSTKSERVVLPVGVSTCRNT